MEDIITELKKRLIKAVQRNKNCSLLFSGGLDTSILAALNPNLKAITVTLNSYGKDIRYAKLLAKKLKIKHFHRTVDIDEAIDSIPEVIKILEGFDPAIPSDLVVYFGLKLAKELRINEVITGDGADELFAGYTYMREIEDLGSYIKKIAQEMEFSSNKMGKYFKIRIIQPFLDKELVDFSLRIGSSLKIKRQNKKLWGKWILRKAFEDILPKETIWQDKRPLEYGSGMTRLRKIISAKISDDEFKQKIKRYPVKFMNKEHLYYYEIYIKLFREIPKPQDNQEVCPGCGAGMKNKAIHCQVCGWTQSIK